MHAAARRVRSSPRADSFSLYLREISRYPLLSRSEEVALARRIRDGDAEALQRLVCANLRFVVSVAKRFQTSGVPLADLVNEGNLGLIAAAKRFDETRGVKFITYAVWWIRQALVHALADQEHVVRVPPPRRGRRFRTRRISLDGPFASSSGATLLERIPDERPPAFARDAEDRALSKCVKDAVRQLRPREAVVVRLYFGLDGDSPMTLADIGTQLGVTRERARQLKEHALSCIRNSSNATTLESFLAV